MTSSPDDVGPADGTGGYGWSGYGPSPAPQAAPPAPYPGQPWGTPPPGPGEQWPGQQWSGQQWTGQQWTGQQWSGQHWPGQQWTGQPSAPQGWTAQAQPQARVQPYGRPCAAPPQYGATSTGRPGAVVTAAVLGFVLGGVGAVLTVVLFLAGAVFGGASATTDVPGFSSLAGAIGGVLAVVAVVALAWTVAVIWGSVWALTGRTRVLLLVGGSIALALTAFTAAAALGQLGDVPASTVMWPVVSFLASLALVVLLALPTTGRWFAARRAARGR